MENQVSLERFSLLVWRTGSTQADFFAYKAVFFSFQNNPKYLDLSYKTDLDIWDCFREIKVFSKQNFIRLV